MLSLLFQKSLSRSLEGQRERGENREIQEETRTASPGGQSARLGTQRAGGPGLAPAGGREAGGLPAGAPAHAHTLTGAHTRGRAGREERCREEVLQEGDWSLAPWGAGGREKDGERAGERGEGLGRRPDGMQGEWEAKRVLVSGWKELKCRSDPPANVLWPQFPPPVRHCCCGCSAASYLVVRGGPSPGTPHSPLSTCLH